MRVAEREERSRDSKAFTNITTALPIPDSEEDRYGKTAGAKQK